GERHVAVSDAGVPPPHPVSAGDRDRASPRTHLVRRTVKCQRNRAGERARVGGGLRLAAARPHHAVVDHECRGRQQGQQRTGNLDQDGPPPAARGTSPSRGRRHYGFPDPFGPFFAAGASTTPPAPWSCPPMSSRLMNGRMLVGSAGTSSAFSGRTRCGVISTMSSVSSARSALLLNSAPTIGSLLRIGIAAPSVWRTLSRRPAIANDWPSRSSTSVSARRVVSAGMRNPFSVTPLVKSSVLTSGRTLRRIVSPAIVGLKFRRTPNSLKITVTVPVAPCTTGTGNSPPARKLASCPL